MPSGGPAPYASPGAQVKLVDAGPPSGLIDQLRDHLRGGSKHAPASQTEEGQDGHRRREGKRAVGLLDSRGMGMPSERSRDLAARALVWIGWIVAAIVLGLGTWFFFIRPPS